MRGLDDGSFTSIREAAAACNVLPPTLAHRITGRQTRNQTYKDESLFTTAAERTIVKWVVHLDKLGFPLGSALFTSTWIPEYCLSGRRQQQVEATANCRDLRTISEPK